MKQLNNHYAIITVIILIVVLLTLLPLLRHYKGDGTLVGDKPYYHARIARDISTAGTPHWDELSYNGRPYLFNPYHYLLAFSTAFTTIETASKILPLIFGLLSVILLTLILTTLKFDQSTIVYALLTLALSPAFLYTFSVSNTAAPALFFSLLSLYLFPHKHRALILISLTSFVGALFFDLIIALFTLTVMITYVINHKDHVRKLYVFITGFIIIYLHHYLPRYLSFGFPQEPTLVKSSFLQSTISDLGAMIGFSPFLLILAMVGLILTWRLKKKIYSSYIGIALLLVLSYHLTYLNAYITVILAIFAGIALDRLTRMRYNFKLIKRLTLILILCGLLFSSISYFNRVIIHPPTRELLKTFEWFGTNNDPGLVIAHYSTGHWITHTAGFPVYTDSNVFYAPAVENRFHLSQQIFNSSSLKETKQLLDEQEIQYIIIDGTIQRNHENDRRGLPYLTRNNETFKNIFSSNSVEIWEFLP